jgi:hypothetical protein
VAVPIARPIVLLDLITGVAIALLRSSPVRWAWAAPIAWHVALDLPLYLACRA